MRYLLCSILVAFLTCGIAEAQNTAQIHGTLKDASGSAVPGAAVKATQTETGLSRTVNSGADGGYVLTNLPIGNYNVEVTKDGFTTAVQTGIVLDVAADPAIDVSLKVGAVTEQISVVADASLVETRSSGISQVVDQQRVVDLPLNGRQATDLIFLAGAATAGVNGDTQTAGKNYPVSTISVAGGRSDGITFLLDGGTHNDTSNSENLPLPFPDALQEFKVETSALPAQYGQHSAAAVNAVTKSGSNDFHGDAFEFIRNGDLNARNFFAPARDELKRNQFGGTFGGPIRKNKLFFFVGYQGTIQRSTPINSLVTIPTPAMIQGNFTQFASAACNNGVAKTLKAPFVNMGTDGSGNTIWQIPLSVVSPPAANLLKLYPVTSNPCGQYPFGLENNEDEHQGVVRIDYQLSDKHSIFGRYYGTHLLQPVAPLNGNILLSSATGTLALDQSLVLGDTYVINPNMVSAFRMTGIRTEVSKITPTAVNATQLGVNMYNLPGSSQTAITLSGDPTIGTVIASGSFPTVTYQFSEDMSIIKGTHQIGFGANYIRGMMNDYSTRFANGQFAFTGQITGTAYGDMMAGTVGTFQQGSTSVFQPRSNYIGLYVQDSWKLTPHLSVNYGLRWEPLIASPTKGGRLSVFELAWFEAGVKSTVYPNAPVGTLFPGDKIPGGGTVPNGISSTNWKDFAPRLGIAWDPQGNGRFTVRAAYGIFYDLPNIFWNNNVGYESPWSGLVSLSGVNFQNPYATVPGGNPFPYNFTTNSPFNQFATYWNGTLTRDPNYMQQWNLSLQKQLGSNWLIAANYMGNEVVHVWNTIDENPAVLLPGAPFASSCAATATNVNCPSNTNERRLLSVLNPAQGAYYSAINTLYDGGTQSYNALLLSVQKRLSRGVTVQGNYTYSHCIGENQVYELTSPNITNTNNLRYDRGNCPSVDHRHLLNISAVGEMPNFSGRALHMLASGWKVSAIITAQSGAWLTPVTGTDTALSGQANERPNVVLANTSSSSQGSACANVTPCISWLNPAAFSVPAAGTYGNAGAGSIEGPGFLSVNMALTREFQIREKQRLEVRGEAFNVINRVNLGPPSLTQNSSTFGQITSTLTVTGLSGSPGDPRILQFALKYYF